MKNARVDAFGVLLVLALGLLLSLFISCTGGDTPETQAMRTELKQIGLAK